MTTALTAELRRRTAAAHDAAEREPLLAALARGDVTRAQLAALLAALVPVHDALERGARDRADDPVVGPFLLPGLERSARLRADVAHLGGASGSPAGDVYAARVDAAARTSAVAFLAHHYVRTLADLSGGQVVRAALERRLGLVDGAGASSFAFPDLRPGEAGRAYRQRLDALALTEDEREELLAEALVAYGCTVAVVRELPGG